MKNPIHRIFVAIMALSAAGLACAFPGIATPTAAPIPTLAPTTAPATATPPASTATPGPTVPPGATLQPEDAQPLIEDRANAVLQALATKDMAALAEYVDPVEGVRFSPYSFVHETDQVFVADQLQALPGSTDEYLWGSFDGSGEPINLTFDAYDERFVYSQDFLNAEEVGYNTVIGSGNTLNNAAEFYPGSIIVEYHFSGFDPQYGGMDWESLRLVFQQRDGTWYLVGIIHDQWTI